MNTAVNNLKGMGLMVLSMLGFTLSDMFLKLASTSVSSGQIVFSIGVGCSLFFWLWMKWQGQPVFTSALTEPAVLLRTSGDGVANIFLVLALTYASFTDVSAIIQTQPLLMTLASYLFLQEKVGMYRLSAVVLGFVGMLLIVQPGTEAFNPYALFAVLGVVGMAMRDLGSRLAHKNHSSVRLAIYGTLGQTLIGLVMMFFESTLPTINLQTMLYLLGLVVFSSLGLILVTKAMRVGEVSAVSPLRYTRLIFGLTVGIIVFNDTINTTILLGCVIILLCGLYVGWRERTLKSD